MNIKKINHVLVYGTLRKDMRLNSVMSECKYKGQFSVSGFKMYYNIHGNFPAIKRGRGEIICELYEVNKERMHQLDFIERVDIGAYARRTIKLLGIESFIYVGKNIFNLMPDWTLVDDGDYKKFADKYNI